MPQGRRSLPSPGDSIISPDLRFLFSHPAHFFALGAGAGLSPRAPGTVGTLVSFPLFVLLMQLPGRSWIFAALVVALVAGIGLCGKTGADLGDDDHGAIVWDEMVAFCLLLAWVPATAAGWAAAFVLFRFFDILKPWPIRQLETLMSRSTFPGGGSGWWKGLGVMLDDLLAAAYALLLIEATLWLI
jgi:phosphatidylglycerophosphatase A